MANTSTCLSPACGITVGGSHRKCPQCGWTMSSQRGIRIRGFVLLACGLFLVIFMGWITLTMLPTLLYPERAYADGSFTGTPNDAAHFLHLFLGVIAFGVLGTINAIYMIVTGRQNRWFVLGTLVAAGLIYTLGWVVVNWSK